MLEAQISSLVRVMDWSSEGENRESIQVLACSLHSYIFKELKKRAAFNLLCKINSELLLEASKCWLSVVHTYLHMQLVDSLLQNHLQITLALQLLY